MYPITSIITLVLLLTTCSFNLSLLKCFLVLCILGSALAIDFLIIYYKHEFFTAVLLIIYFFYIFFIFYLFYVLFNITGNFSIIPLYSTLFLVFSLIVSICVFWFA